MTGTALAAKTETLVFRQRHEDGTIQCSCVGHGKSIPAILILFVQL